MGEGGNGGVGHRWRLADREGCERGFQRERKSGNKALTEIHKH